ncbi:MAG: DUF2911 domain-containing protein [Vicinamibacterales bacterium]
MRTWAVAIGLVLGAVGALPRGAGAQTDGPPIVPRTNPRATVSQRIGVTDVSVTYNRPATRGRRIFGGLVPYGEVWRTGSDEATTLTVSTAFTIQGRPVDAGTYEVFSIPGPAEWQIILQRHKAQWGAYAYDPADDVVRVAVVPEVAARPVESFSIAVDEVSAGGATLVLAWERTRVPVALAVDTVGLVVPRLETAMQGPGKRPYFLGAMFYFENNLDLATAARWMAAAVAESPGHIGMLHRQALILERLGDTEGARRAAQLSLDGAAASPAPLREEYRRLNQAVLDRLK